MPALRIGSSGDAVLRLQQQLQAAGFDPGGVDGQYGQNTKSAVVAFQRSRGLAVDGIAGNATLRAIAGVSSFEPARPPGAPTTETASGYSHHWKQFREVDVDRLRDALPPQAKHLAQDFVDSAREHGVDPLTLVAISQHETGNWTSSAFRNKNNAMGISSSRGPIQLSSVRASIDQMARQLASPTGYYRNAETLRQLWGVYAPGPATGQPLQRNDPNNQNRFWGPGILSNLRDLERAVGLAPPA